MSETLTAAYAAIYAANDDQDVTIAVANATAMCPTGDFSYLKLCANKNNPR